MREHSDISKFKFEVRKYEGLLNCIIVYAHYENTERVVKDLTFNFMVIEGFDCRQPLSCSLDLGYVPTL